MLNDWLKAVFPGKSVAYTLVGINVCFFLWCNLTTKKEKRWKAFENFSYSYETLKNREYLNLMMNPLVSRRVDDFVIDTGILLTLGTIFK